MLVLTRKLDQSIMIGDDVEISVLAVSGDKVRIGIEAPREVPVFRKEVYDSLGDGQRSTGEGLADAPAAGAPVAAETAAPVAAPASAAADPSG